MYLFLRKWNSILFSLIALIIFGCDGDQPSESSDENPPQAPQRLEAKAITDTEISLSWKDMSDNEEGFEVEESISTSSDFFLMTTATTNTTFLNVARLQSNETYYFRVRAINQYGASEYSNNARAVTSEVPPTAPSELNSEIVSETQIRLTWIDSSGNEDGFEVYERINKDSSFSLLTQVGRNANAYLLTDKTPLNSYYYTVRAFNDYGNSTFTDTVSVPAREIPPIPPIDLEARSISETEIRLTWQDESVIEEGYTIFESIFNDSSFSIVAQTDKDIETLLLSNKSPGIYFYRIQAFNQFGLSESSDTSRVLFIKLINEFRSGSRYADTNSIAFSPDSRFLADGRNGIRVWESYEDKNNEQLVYSLSAGSITSLAYSPDGQYIASGHQDGIVGIWRSSDGELLDTLHYIINNNDVYSISFHPNSRNLAVGFDNTKIEIWDIIECQMIHYISGGGNLVIYRPDGQNIASIPIPEHVVYIWDVDNYRRIRSISHNYVMAISYSHDGLLLASRSIRYIKLWNSSDGNLVRTIDTWEREVDYNTLDFSYNDQYLASIGSNMDEIRIWDVLNGELVGRFSEPPEYYIGILDMEFSPDGRYIAVGMEYGYIQIWGRFQ